MRNFCWGGFFLLNRGGFGGGGVGSGGGGFVLHLIGRQTDSELVKYIV